MDEDFQLPIPPPLRYRTHEPVLTSSWTRVDQFSATRRSTPDQDDDDEWEEEEVEYVTLDFGPHLSRQTLLDSTSFQLLAAESSTPIVRIGNLYFKGHHETCIGTEILLEPQQQQQQQQQQAPIGGEGGQEGTGTGTEGGMQVFATTGSNRIVLKPVTIDYAQRIPELVGEQAMDAGDGQSEARETTGNGARGRGRGRGRSRGRARGRGGAVSTRSTEGLQEETGLDDGESEQGEVLTAQRKRGRPKGSGTKPRESIIPELDRRETDSPMYEVEYELPAASAGHGAAGDA